jgi:hypothetical protein
VRQADFLEKATLILPSYPFLEHFLCVHLHAFIKSALNAGSVFGLPKGHIASVNMLEKARPRTNHVESIVNKWQWERKLSRNPSKASMK